MKHEPPDVFAKATPLAKRVTPKRSAGEILRLMRRMLARPEDWLKGGYIDTGNKVCVIAALNRSIGSDDTENTTAYRTLLSCAPDNGYQNYKRITRWNDAPERTHAHVVALLDKAIKREDRLSGR